VAFNVYWLWVLGNVVERELGAGRYVGFVLAAALVSSSLQLAASDTTGHGASGVVYALFGLMWASRRRVPAFAEALGDRTVPLFVIWLLGCIVATAAGVADIANAAHVGGLIFGWLAARWSFPGAPRRSLAIAGTGFLSLIALVPLFWSPWSSTWVGHQAYKAHLAGDYDRAAAGYRRCMSLGGDRAWALANLALVRHTQGAQADYEKALAELRAEDPAAADELEAELREPADDAATP
jgi:GlpG protein